MARLGTFVPRLVALTLVWLLATAALTYAAAQRINSVPATTTTATTPAAPATVVVPDVRHQAYVFAEGTLGDAGFSWRVEGSVEGYAANTVLSQTPAAGTRLVDTGAPTIVLHLMHPAGASLDGIPQEASTIPGTAVKLADLADATLPAATKTAATTIAPAATPAVVKKASTKKATVAKTAAKKTAKTPAHRWPQHRPPAFVVAGARREPLDEMPLQNRAQALVAWLAKHPSPTNANVHYWLYQHAWIVDGAELGWWHGQQALETLIVADRHVFSLWGIGDRSEAVARSALAEVEARSS